MQQSLIRMLFANCQQLRYRTSEYIYIDIDNHIGMYNIVIIILIHNKVNGSLNKTIVCTCTCIHSLQLTSYKAIFTVFILCNVLIL